MDPSRPLDALNNNRDSTVRVELKNSRIFTGTLKSFDIHINTVLFNATEVDAQGAKLADFGTLFIRGDTIQIISPEE